MTEIEKSADLNIIRLYSTIKNIFEMYCAIVPIHHKKFMESFPQQVGESKNFLILI